MKKSFYALCFISLVIGNANAQNYRYVKSIYSETVISTGIIYDSALFLNFPYTNESSTTIRELEMDIVQPKGDILNNRPAIIFAHGGGFISGNRDVDDMVALCDSFARKGYVAATIDYRQGVEVVDNSNLHYTRAAYRGLQDGRAAVRFLRANAEVYGIDPDKIYWGGNSAGSFIGLNSIYLDPDEKPSHAGAISYINPFFPFNTINAPDLGGLDIGSNLSYSGEPNAVMALWGGVGDTLIIEAENNQAVFLVHGIADQVVPFNSGAPFNLSNIAPVYGSNSINTRLNNIEISACDTYFVQGEGHEFYGVFNGNWTNGTGGNAYWDTIVQKATNFYWQQHKPMASFNYVTNDFDVEFFDMSSGATSWFWDFGDGNTSSQQNPNHSYLNNDTYHVQLYIENNIESWDTISHKLTIVQLGIEKINTNRFHLFPNPSNGIVTLYSDTPLEQETLQIYNVYGQLFFEMHNLNGHQVMLNLSNLENGIYFIRVSRCKESTVLKFTRN